MFGKNIIYEKNPSKNFYILFSPDSKTNKTELHTSLMRVIDSLPKKEKLSKATVRKVINLEETIEKLAQRITDGMKMNFKDFYGQDLGANGEITYEKKVMIIVGFLAMLELVKRGILDVKQENNGEIEMEKVLN